ncbi:MAG: hypothetical protein ONB06_08310, partial [candidate division KSB1 bacterium]|nr:hypothetical protein [candidate division KSB1 bacterium]
MGNQRAKTVVIMTSYCALLLQVGCSFMEPATQMIAIHASDPDAEISVDGRAVGRGTATVSLQRKRSHTVTARVGERAGSATIDRRVSTMGMLDLVGGVVLVVLWMGVLGVGFWGLGEEGVVVRVGLRMKWG